MKKNVCIIIIFMLLISTSSANNINVCINGNYISDAVSIDGCTMIPLRTLLSFLNITDITWYELSNSAEIQTYGKNIFVQIGSDYIIVNDEIKTLPVPSYIENGVTFVPLRAVAESLDAYVSWNEASQLITIKKF